MSSTMQFDHRFHTSHFDISTKQECSNRLSTHGDPAHLPSREHSRNEYVKKILDEVRQAVRAISSNSDSGCYLLIPATPRHTRAVVESYPRFGKPPGLPLPQHRQSDAAPHNHRPNKARTGYLSVPQGVPFLASCL